MDPLRHCGEGGRERKRDAVEAEEGETERGSEGEREEEGTSSAPTELASVERMTDQLDATTNKNLSVSRSPPPVGGGERETDRGERGATF